MIAIGSDHGGYALKKALMAHLDKRGLEYKDFGTYSEASCDYPVFAKAVAHAVASGECECGILVCGTGIGVSITANKVPGIRAALCGDCFSAEVTREHNDANVLCMGARIIAYAQCEVFATKFLETEFMGGKHKKRIDMFEPA